MADTNQPPKLLYKKRDAAEMLSMSERRIDDLRRGGKLLSVKDGKESKYRHEDLQRYVDSLQAFVGDKPI